MAGGLEQGSGGLGRVSKGVGGWGLERAEGLGPGGGGWTLRGRPDGRSDGRSLVRSFVRSDGRKIHPSVLQDIVPFGSAAQKGHPPTF